ncbi:MAG: acyl carrier protein [Rhodothermales bacterium]|nr:acyl carrier protein [Rhodothermales bacterium]
MKDTLKRYIEQELLSGRGAVAVGDDENLLGSGLVDSVGMMSLVLFIEDAFALRVPPEDVTIEHFLSVNTICAYVQERKVTS